MGTIEVVINYICLNDEANGFCRYSPELTSRIEIDDPSWDGYTQLGVRQPKNAVLLVGRGAGEQGSRGEICTSFPPAPPHLCPSACHHAKFAWRSTSDRLSSSLPSPHSFFPCRQPRTVFFISLWHCYEFGV
ncbi:hypothetical protein NIES23_60600 (plasmid) [Trichormus variabilis NIES-23]|uniref:Uncharacterized protein n=1 Tax=Trichormus variabilis NIES-23 TaxID=1973479 RepID=A0A1Z4KWG5_ANAVA|nr:hypothetical protein NIES23_60600 [Trichormus variabilis NIES-23]